MRIEVAYYAQLREAAGCETECIDVDDTCTAAELYRHCAAAHDLPLSESHLRIARNDAFVDWSTPLTDGDRVAFIPPVSGG